MIFVKLADEKKWHPMVSCYVSGIMNKVNSHILKGICFFFVQNYQFMHLAQFSIGLFFSC